MSSPSEVIDRVNVKVSGRGTRTLVFAHGFGCNQAMWRSVAPAFEEQFHVVLFEYAARRQCAGFGAPGGAIPLLLPRASS